MNKLMLIVGVIVAGVYFGGSNVPKVLRDNKKMLCGVLVGVVLSVLMGSRLEGYNGGKHDDVSGIQRILNALQTPGSGADSSQRTAIADMAAEQRRAHPAPLPNN